MKAFIGIEIASEFHPHLLPTVKKLRVDADKKEMLIKWQPPQKWHITLVFLGDIEVRMLSDVQKVLENKAAEFCSFYLHLSRMGAFPDDVSSRVVWVGVQKSQSLLDLQSALEQELQVLGFRAEHQEYIPHLTLGRLRNPRNTKDLLSPFVRKKFGSLPVQSIGLFESRLQGHHPIYIKHGSFDLAPFRAKEL